MKDLIAAMSARLRKFRDRLSPRREAPFPEFDPEGTEPESAEGKRIASPGIRNLAAFFEALIHKKAFILVAGGLAVLSVGLLFRLAFQAAPLSDKGSFLLENRQILLDLEIPEPPMPYDEVVLSRDPGAFPGKEEADYYSYAVSDQALRESAEKARAAVDAFFMGVP